MIYRAEMIFPIPGVAGNDAASRCHQIRFFHSAVCRSSPGISGTGIFVSRGLPSVMASDRYDVRLQPHRRDRIRGRSVVSGSHCDEQPCKKAAPARAQLPGSSRSRRKYSKFSYDKSGVCPAHTGCLLSWRQRFRPHVRPAPCILPDGSLAQFRHTDRWNISRFHTGSLPHGFHARCRHTVASVRRQSLQTLRFSRKDPDAARSRCPAPLPSHLFRKARLPLPRSRGQLSLPCSRHTHPFSFRIWKDGGRGVLHFMEDSEKESCKAGFSACGGSRKRHSTIPPQCDPRGAFSFHRTHFPMK